MFQINGSIYDQINAQEWLVTPALDLSNEDAASLFFDMSYALNEDENSDLLQILISDNNGLSYTPSSYLKQGDRLATTNELINAWSPSVEDDWRKDQLDLSKYVGNTEVRVAFVFVNRGANALYLDNVEFFKESDPDTKNRSELATFGPSPLRVFEEELNLYFQLEERQAVHVTIYNQMGQEVYSNQFSDVLNQHYALPLNFDIPGGMMILQMTGNTFQKTERIVLIK